MPGATAALGIFFAVGGRLRRGYFLGITLVVMRLYGNFVAVIGGCAAAIRHHLGGDAVSRQLRCGYWGMGYLFPLRISS